MGGWHAARGGRGGGVMEFAREKRLRTRSVAGTMALGETVAEMLLPTPAVVILRGEVGAGKTTLVKGIAEALGASTAEEVTSPTFTLVHEYAGKTVRVLHLDLYRLETEEEVAALGLEEMAGEEDALLLVEWGERFESVQTMATAEIAMGQGEAETERLLLIRWGRR